MTRWWFILLAVVLGWFTPAHAFAHTRTPQGEYDVEASLEKVVSVAGITMDTYQGNNQDPLSLHKYIYCQGNPGNGIDPSGHGEDVDVMAGSFGSVAVDGFSAAADMAAKKGMKLTIQQIGLGLAATTLLMEELGFGGGDTVATMQTQIAQRDNPTRSTYATKITSVFSLPKMRKNILPKKDKIRKSLLMIAIRTRPLEITSSWFRDLVFLAC